MNTRPRPSDPPGSTGSRLRSAGVPPHARGHRGGVRRSAGGGCWLLASTPPRRTVRRRPSCPGSQAAGQTSASVPAVGRPACGAGCRLTGPTPAAGAIDAELDAEINGIIDAHPEYQLGVALLDLSDGAAAIPVLSTNTVSRKRSSPPARPKSWPPRRTITSSKPGRPRSTIRSGPTPRNSSCRQ